MGRAIPKTALLFYLSLLGGGSLLSCLATAHASVGYNTTARVGGIAEETSGLANSVKVVYLADLGRSRSYHIRLKLLRSGGIDGIITAKFICTDHGGHVRVFLREIGPVLGNKYECSAVDYFGFGHKQVFVRAGTRASDTCLIDCDGTRVKTLYQIFNLFVPSMVHLIGQRRWLIEEYERRMNVNPYACPNDGTYYLTTDDWQYEPYSASDVEEHRDTDVRLSTVCRLLKWNGDAVVPAEPGKTRVVITTYRRYLRKHGLTVPKRYTHPTVADPPTAGAVTYKPPAFGSTYSGTMPSTNPMLSPVSLLH